MNNFNMWNLCFLIFPVLLEFVEGKYCQFDDRGEIKFYACQRTEYCCNFGCCVSPAFQFYQLWYYWLLVIFMFLLCSGGGWWYRCWLRGRFAESQIPPLGRSNNNQSRRSTIIRTSRTSSNPVTTLQTLPPESPGVGPVQNQFQVARVSYSTSGDRLILHRVWKDARGNFHSLDSPPSYTTSRTDGQTSYIPAMNIMVDPYVLYGPPPSYDSVMQQDQGAGPSGTQIDDNSTIIINSPSPIEEESSQQISPMTPPSPQYAQSPISEDEIPPSTSHQASQTMSPLVSPTNPNPL